MKVFISHPHEYVHSARELAAKLRASGYEAFFDRNSLPAGEGFDRAIEHWVRSCDLMVFYVTPQSTSVGRYCLTELSYAEQRWPNPSGRVLPVAPAGVRLADVPAYLRASVTVFRTEGNFETEVAFEAARLLESGKGWVRASDELPKREIRIAVETIVEQLSIARAKMEGSTERIEAIAKVDEAVRLVRRNFLPQEGRVVAGARLERVIGAGNFGTVWEAYDPELDKKVAVKVFRLERLEERQMLHRFRRSIRAMRLLNEYRRLRSKPRSQGTIVKFHRADETTLAFSMDLLHGGNLDDVDRLGWSSVKKLEVAIDVCAAIQYSHANGVIHRDIKPANIVLNERHEPVLTDFDIADVKWATSLSTAGEGGLGTPVFAAPEQLFNAEQADERSDIYSLGRLLYYLLLERSPGFAIHKDPPLTNLSGEAPGLVEVVRRATQYEPARRFSTVSEMMLALEQCMGGAAAWRARLSRMRRGVQNHWAAVTIVSLIFSGLTYGTLYNSKQARLQRELTADAEAARERAEEERRRSERAMQNAEEARAQAEEHRQESDRLREEVQSLSEQQEENMKHLIEYGENKNRLKATLKTKRRALTRLHQRTKEYSKLAEEISKHEEELTTVEAQIQDLSDAQATLSRRLASIQKQACAAVQDRAQKAMIRSDWNLILSATKQRTCWTGAEKQLERRRLRVTAFAELGNFAKCVKEGRNSIHREIVARVTYCQHRLAEQG